MIVIESPIYVMLRRKTKPDKKYSLTANVFFGMHRMTYNTLKNEYTEKMRHLLCGLKIKNPISIEFGYWKQSRRVIDSSNFIFMVDKFFCDALVEHGCIENDDDSVIVEKIYKTMGIDKERPRVDIKITEHIAR